MKDRRDKSWRLLTDAERRMGGGGGEAAGGRSDFKAAHPAEVWRLTT